MPLVRKRRAPVEEQPEDEATPSQTPQPRRRQDSSDEDSDGYPDGEENTQNGGATIDQLVKKMVRYALSCEYARQPIRRPDVTQKVLGTHSRQFKAVFAEAQFQLQTVFGMKMVELPLKEKITIQQRRAAQKSEKAATSSNSWILTSVLPPQYRDPEVIPPPKVPTVAIESAYIGLYTFIISVIYLAGGALPEAKLERCLKRANAEQTTPIDRTDKLLARLVREGYIVKVKDSSSGEEVVEYMVGPRGKAEIGEDGVAGVVRSVYGENATEDLDRRIQRSLGLGETQAPNGTPAVNGQRRGPGRPRREAEEEQEADGTEDGD